MLAISQIKDLFAGKLPDPHAYQCLLDLNKEKPSAAMLNELVNSILETNDCSANESLLQEFGSGTKLIDCCSTGGSGLSHYNTSTAVSFVLASGGLNVVKFGNRSASSLSGSFDFLESLGMAISLPVEKIFKAWQQTKIAFLFAPHFYPTLAKLAPIRKAINVPTILNIIYPLLSPLKPSLRLLGTTNQDAQQAIADYLFSYTANEKSFVIRAMSGLDELDPVSANSIMQVDRSGIKEISYPADSPADIYPETEGSLTAKDNAFLFKEIISTPEFSGTYFQDLITLNAAAGFLLAGKVDSFPEGQELATHLLQSGKVLAKYEQCRRIYAELA